MAENKFTQFIPPNLRGPLTDVGIFGRVASDNILGFLDNYFLGNRFDDDYESTGEMLGTAFREQPIETGKALGTGIYEAGKSVYEDPEAAFGSALEGLEGVFDRLNTPYDQLDLSTEEAQRQRAGDLAVLGEALSGAGIITKSLTKLTKKQLKEKVIQENPGLNEDQVNSIVEDTGYDPIDDGRRSPALVETDGFPMQVLPENTVPTNMEVPTVEGFEGIPIVTAAGRVIGSVLDPEEPDVDGNLYGPPDEVTLSEIIADQDAYFEALVDYEARFDRLGNQLTDDADIIERAIQIHSEEGFPDLDPDRERLIREELDRVLDAQRAMEPDIGPRRLRADERVPSYRVGDIIVSENLGEGVVTDDGMIDYNGIRISSATPVIGVHIDEVGRDITDAILDDEPPPTTFDELLALGLVDEDDDLARLETMLPQAQVAERVTARDEAVGLFLSQRGLSPTQAQDLLFEDGAPELMEELREFVSQRTQQTLPSENEIFYRIESARMADIPEGQVMDAILLDEFGDRLPDDDADVPLTEAQEAALIDELNELSDTPTNTNIQRLDTTWLTQPGYGRFTDDATTPIDRNFSSDAELAAGDIGLTSENSYLTSRMDTALSDLSQTQTKFASLEQLVNTLTKKYGVQPAELQARGIPTSQVEADLLFTNNFTPKADFDFSKDKVDLNDPFYQNILNKDPFVVRTLGGADVVYPNEFTKGVTNYRETLINLSGRPDLLRQGVKDTDHYDRHQRLLDGPTVLHIRTGEFPVQGGGYDRKKAFHLGEIQSQVEKNSRPSRKANDLIRDVVKKMELPDDLEFRIPEGFSINQLAEDLQSTSNKIKDVRQLKDVIDAYDRGATTEIEKYFANKNLGRPRAVKAFTENTGKTEAEYYRMMGQARFDRLQAEVDKALDKYNIYKKGSDEVYTSGALFLDDFERNLVQTYNKRKLTLLDPDETGPGDFLKDIMKFGGESFNASDYGVGSIFTTDRITRMGIKEALQQAVDTDADFFTLGTGQMAKDMTYGKLSGQIEYYDEIVPKMFRKIMGEISKDTGIKMPELRKRKMETLGDDGKVVVKEVLGIELTDELREVFKSKKVQAFKEGGLATLSSSLRPKLRPGTQLRRPKLRPGTLESLKEQIKRDDRQTKGFGDLEYRAELEPQFSYNPIARLGYDPDRHRVVNVPTGPAGYREGFSTALYANRLRGGEKTIANLMSLGLSREDAERIKTDNIITSSNLSVPPVIAHEFTHRGFNVLREERDKDPEAFDEKYGKEAGEILNYSKHKYPGGIGQSLEEYYVEMFDDLDTRFNTSSQRVDEDYEDFPKNTMRATVQSSFAGPTKPLRDYSPEADDKRFEQIRAFQDKVLNLRGIDKGILRLMDAAQDILTERGEPPKTKPRLKEENLNFFQKIGKAIGLKDGGLATLAKEVL